MASVDDEGGEEGVPIEATDEQIAIQVQGGEAAACKSRHEILPGIAHSHKR